jgi:hypothetical protein
MRKMAKFVLEKGRSNISDITEQCNTIVDLTADAEKFTKEREQVELLSADAAGKLILLSLPSHSARRLLVVSNNELLLLIPSPELEVESEGKDNPGGRK